MRRKLRMREEIDAGREEQMNGKRKKQMKKSQPRARPEGKGKEEKKKIEIIGL
jgi:hypothetical protein